jgi:hypothetical protein
MRCDFSVVGCEEGKLVPRRDTFRYLNSMLQSDGDIEEDVCHRIKAGWMKWRQSSSILCDKKVLQKLKGKFYRTQSNLGCYMEQNVSPLKGLHI